MFDYEPQDVECRQCGGEGQFEDGGPICCGNAEWECGAQGCTGPIDGRQLIQCQACHGTGWRAMTEDEANDAAADAFSDMCESEPPISALERLETAWKQKQGLRK